MRLLAPGYLVAAAATAMAVTLLHFLSRRRPRPRLFPTARFVPMAASQASALTRRPSDLVLLLIRLTAVLASGLALARPMAETPRRTTVRVVVADLSAAVADSAAAREAAAALAGDGDTVIFVRGPERGALSAGLAAAVRAALRLGARAESLELALVSPLTEAQWDEATAAIRALWRGRALLVRTRPAPATRYPVEPLAAADPLRTTIALAGFPAPRSGAPLVRLRRSGPLSHDDSAFASSGGTAVLWPRSTAATDSADAVYSAGAAAVGPFPALAAAPGGDARGIAWTNRGIPIAWESSYGSGCLRVIGFDVPASGDHALRTGMRRMAARLLAPCNAARNPEPLDTARLAALAGGPSLWSGRDATFAAPPRGATPLVVALLALAFASLAAEWWWRRREPEPAA